MTNAALLKREPGCERVPVSAVQLFSTASGFVICHSFVIWPSSFVIPLAPADEACPALLTASSRTRRESNRK